MPIEFELVKIGDLGKVVTGKTPSTAREEYFGADYPFITPTDIDGNKRYVETERYLSQESKKDFNNYLLPSGAVCVVCIGATIGKICMTKVPSFTNQQINSIIVDDERYDNFFIYYLLSTKKEHIKNIAGGAATPIVSKSAFSDIYVEAPKLSIQHKIAAILSAYDDLIENNLRRIKILEEMAQSIYREWFVKFRFPACAEASAGRPGHHKVKMVDSPLGKIPEGWEVSEFRGIFDIKYGKTLPKTEIKEKGLFPVYGAGDVIGYYDKAICQEKCALVTSRGNGSGTVWRTREAAFVTNNSLIILPQEKLRHWNYSFVELLLKHSNVMKAKTGSAQPQVTIENLNYVKAIVPPKEIVERFCAFATSLYEHVDLLFKKNAILRQTRDLLLPKLIFGELDVSDLDIKTGINSPSPLVGEGWDGGNE